jgi:hypothetical protein
MPDDEEHQCYCKDLKGAALSAHLSCLKKYWEEGSQLEGKLAQELLQNVAHHRFLEAGTTKASAHDSECTACLRWLLEAGIKISTVLQSKPERYDHRKHPLSSAAASGCVSCFKTMLDSIAGTSQVIPGTLWLFGMKGAVSALQLDGVKMLLDAVPDELRHKLQQYALIRVCRTHKVRRTFGQADEKHEGCFPNIRPILEFLHEDCDIDINESWTYESSEKRQHWATALSCMIQHGCVDGLQWLCEVAGADVNNTGGDGKYSALHAASTGWCRQLDINAQLVATLAELGADLYVTTSSGATVLHTAALSQNTTALEHLVTLCNCDSTEAPLIAQQDDQGHTPLHAVILNDTDSWRQWPRTELVRLLLN